MITNIKISELTSIIDCLLPERSIMLFGRHGIGKSMVIYQIAKEMDLPVIERRLSQITEDLILGIPYLDQKQVRKDLEEQNEKEPITKMTLFRWIQIASEKPVILFLDEIDRASLEVQQAAFQLAGSRKLWNMELHKGTCVICAGNGHPDYLDQYPGVREMGPALLDRFWVGYLDPSIGEWIEWAEENSIHPLIISFIKENPDLIEVKDQEYLENVVYPTRRAWSWASIALKQLEAKNRSMDRISLLISGFVSMETAMQFQSYYFDSRQIKIADLIACNEKAKKIDTLSMGQAVDMINRMVKSEQWKETSTDEKIGVIEFLGKTVKSDSIKDAVFQGMAGISGSVLVSLMENNSELFNYFNRIRGFNDLED